MRRFLSVLAGSLTPLLAGPDTVVTFNEIHYAPAGGGPEWVELCNQFSIPVDVGGWRLAGGMEFTIPEGTVMAPGARLVVSKTAGNPAGALGPFGGILDNAGEELRLHTRHGRLMDQVRYEHSGGWPVLPAGYSLAKAWPLRGSGAAENWTASSAAGGTPGGENFPGVSGPAMAAHRVAFTTGSYWTFAPAGVTPPADWTELTFRDGAWSRGPGFFATAVPGGSSPATVLPPEDTGYFRKAFVLPPGIQQPQLILSGLLRGEAQIYLDGAPVSFLAAAGHFNRLIDCPSLTPGTHQLAVRIAAAADGMAWDASLAMISPDRTLPPPAAPVTGPVVINEILYHKRPQYRSDIPAADYAENPEEFVELHNPGAEPVDVSAWRFTGGVSYTFPEGTVIGPGGFLAVNQTQFSGRLGDGGERINLHDAAGGLVDEVAWADGGRWPEAADGGGVSLELMDPGADNASPESWAASLEEAPWQTVTYRAMGAEPPNTNNPDTWREFLFGLLDSGEVLVDDVRVTEDPAGTPVALIQNGTFENDIPGQTPAKWRCLGTHRDSVVIADPGGTGKVLRIRADGPMEHTYNCCATTFAGNRVINPAKTYEISFRAKWLSGSPQLNSRLYLNRCARTTILAQPAGTGTPGAANSRRIANAGPAAGRLRHSPVIPAATQAVCVSADLYDPDQIVSAVLFYRVDGGVWQQTEMAGENGGRFAGLVPGQADGAVVQFYVQATDGAGAVSYFPAAGPDSRALFRAGDGGGSSQTVRTKIRCLMTAADAAGLHDPLAGVSNHRWGCTVIDGDHDVYYDAGVRLRSAPFGRNGIRAGWNISMGAHQPFRGVHNSIVIDGAFNMPKGDGSGWLENSVGPSINEMLYQLIAGRAGKIPSSYDDICWFQAPLPGYNRLAQLKQARFNRNFLDSFFDGGDAGGTLYKQELIYYPSTTVDGNPESLKNPYNSVRDLDIKSLGPAPDSYRFTYLLQNNTDRDDFSRILNMAGAFDSPAASLYVNSFNAIDTGNWMRVLAMNALTGLVDTYNMGLAHNMLFYARPSDGRVMLFPWDQDHAFYTATSAGIFGAGTHRAAAVVALPQNRRLFCKHLLDLCATGFRNDYLDSFISALCAAGQRPGYAYNFKTWVASRRAYVISQVSAQQPFTPFAITTGGGADFAVTASAVTLEGNGWVDIDAIRLETTGEILPVTWTGGSTWQVTVPLGAGQNGIVLTALTMQGGIAGTDTIRITNNGPEAASAANTVVSEIHYHPADPGGGTLEFIELQNAGTRSVDLTGCAFTAGIAFAFPDGTVIPPRGYLLVVQNAAAFAAHYGSGLPVAGEWSALSRLSNGGDRVVLAGRGGRVIRDFSYDDAAPWPVTSDGGGPSLVLDAPLALPDHGLAASWRASTAPGGSPGAADPVPGGQFLTPVRLSSVLVSPPQVTQSGSGIDLVWTELPGAGGYRVTPQVSHDLIHWEADPGDGSRIRILSTAESAAGRTITARPVPGRDALYFRLRIERP